MIDPLRWIRAALLVFAVGGCGGGTGVDIEIYLPDGVKATRVEVWIAYDPCDTCPSGIAWSDRGAASGEIYFLRDEEVIEAAERPDRWVLHLDAAPGFGDPKAMALVAFDGDKVNAVRVLRSVHIPNSAEIWKVYLDPADLATPDLATAPSDPARDHRGHMWARQPTSALANPTGCFVYQQWDGSTWATEFFVPKSDPDCDGFPPETECNAYWYQYKKPSGSCVGDQLLPGTCTLGISACEDGVSNDRTCQRESGGLTSCVPDAICDKCIDQIPAETCAPTAARDAHVANTLFHYDCAVDATTDGTNCQDQHVEVQLPFTGKACSTIAMHYLDKPFSEPLTSLMYGTTRVTAVFNVVANACVVDIYWFGNASAFQSGLLFLLEIGYENGTRAFYPIELKRSPQVILCTAVMLKFCTPSGDPSDGVSACSRQ